MKHTVPLRRQTQQSVVSTVNSKAVLNPLQLKAEVNNSRITINQNPLQLLVARTAKPTNNPLQFQSKKENKTGLPGKLKENMEVLSGNSMDDVQVHYNSDKPEQLQALAYAQGTDIHIAPGQKKHLPHEAWHVVQQKQGRVRETMQMKGGVGINDDRGLEREADIMGKKSIAIEKQYSGQLKKNNYNIENTLRTSVNKNYNNTAPAIQLFSTGNPIDEKYAKWVEWLKTHKQSR